MSPAKRRDIFLESDEGKVIRRTLREMAVNSSYNTASTYTPNTLKYPTNIISFVDRHIDYLSTHPNLEASKYIANIKLMTRVR